MIFWPQSLSNMDQTSGLPKGKCDDPKKSSSNVAFLFCGLPPPLLPLDAAGL